MRVVTIDVFVARDVFAIARSISCGTRVAMREGMRRLLLSLLFVAAGCGDAGPTSDFAASTSAVKGGAPDLSRTSVLAVGHDVDGGMLCSASLLAPDLVLTAWHCVSDMASVGRQPVCGGAAPTPRPPAHPASKVFVVDGADVYASRTFFKVAEVLGPPSGPNMCGGDLAVLRLERPLLDRAPIAPRLDAPPVVSEPVTVIGFGQREPLDAASDGVRSFVETTVDHVGEEVIGGRVRATDAELTVAEGPCAGDSGGPLLDASGKTIGVMSRGTQRTCEHMIYGRLDAHAAWLKELGRASAERLGQDVPEWVEPKPTAPEDAGVDAGGPTVSAASPSESDGCGAGRTKPSGASALLALSALAAVWLVRPRARGLRS